MIGGGRFALARARAARPALLTLLVVCAVAAALIVAMAVALRVVEAQDVRAALASVGGDRGQAAVTLADGDSAELAAVVGEVLAAHGTTAVEIAVVDGRVTITPDAARFSGDDVVALAAALRVLPAEARDSLGDRPQVTGGLEYTLSVIAEGLRDRRGPAAVAIGLLGLLTVVVVGAVALEPVRARAGESLLLRARGARKRSLGVLAGVETLLVALVGALLGVGAALGISVLLGLPGPGWLFAVLTVVAVGAAAAVVAAIVTVRAADSRPTRAQVAAFAGAAVVLAVVTGLAAWQFAQSGTPIVTRGDGGATLDPLVAIAPALLLALAALLAVLVATPLARLIAASFAHQRGVAPVTPLRLASRRPARHALPIAVVAFAVGTATIAGAYGGTVAALGDAPEALRVGADVRVTTIPDTIDAQDVIDAAGPVDAAMRARAFTAKGGQGRIPVIAVQGTRVGDIMLDAGGTLDPAAVGAAITPTGAGIPLAGDTVTFTLSTPVPEVQEWEGEQWQPEPTGANIGFIFASDAGELWHTSLTNVEAVNEEEVGRGTLTTFEVDADYTATISLPEPAGATWSLAAVEVSLAGWSWSEALTLHDVSSGGESVDLSGLVPAPGTPGTFSQTDAGAVFQPELTGNDLPATRVLAPGTLTVAPVVMTQALAASLSLEVGETISLEFDNPDLDADVVVAATVPVLPGSATGEGLLVDIGALSLLAPSMIVANQAWFATDAPDVVADAVSATFTGPTVLVADPRQGAAAAATAWGFVLAAAGAAVLALIVLTLRRTRGRADARELALLAVFGLGRARAARLRAGEDLFALAMGVAGGVAAGTLTAWLIVSPLVRAAYGTVPDAYPVPLVWPWLWLAAALVALVAVFAAVIASVRAPRSLAVLLREDE